MSKPPPDKTARRWGRTGLELAILLAIVFAIYAWRTQPLLPADGRTTAPGWVLRDIDGGTLSSDELAGRPAVLYFFAPWCTVCNASAHQLRWFDAWSGQDVALIHIALDFEDVASVREYARRHRIAGPVLLGDAATAARFRVFGFPTYYTLDAAGRIASRDFGYTTAVGLWLRALSAGG